MTERDRVERAGVDGDDGLVGRSWREEGETGGTVPPRRHAVERERRLDRARPSRRRRPRRLGDDRGKQLAEPRLERSASARTAGRASTSSWRRPAARSSRSTASASAAGRARRVSPSVSRFARIARHAAPSVSTNDAAPRAAGQRLEPERARAGVEVEHRRAVDRAHEVEERLAHAVAASAACRAPFGAAIRRPRCVPPMIRTARDASRAACVARPTITDVLGLAEQPLDRVVEERLVRRARRQAPSPARAGRGRRGGG